MHKSIYSFKNVIVKVRIIKKAYQAYFFSIIYIACFQYLIWTILSLKVDTVLQGGEKLNVKIINSKKFRSQNGGWIQPNLLSSTMKSSMANAAESIVYVSTYTQYSVIGGVFITLLVLLFLRISFELIWSLVKINSEIIKNV